MDNMDMKISNAQWHDGPTGEKKVVICATIDGQIMWVPVEPDNIHYKEIIKQVKEGTLTIKDAD